WAPRLRARHRSPKAHSTSRGARRRSGLIASLVSSPGRNRREPRPQAERRAVPDRSEAGWCGQEFTGGWPICRAVITRHEFIGLGYLLACCRSRSPGEPMLPFRPEASCPLDGISVLDLSRLVAGNMLSLQLADFGAEVVKVEDPDHGDPLRAWRVEGHSLFWKVYARNKKSITLDLRKARAKELLLDLAQRSHVLIENFRPGTLERMGLAPATLQARNPR